MKFKNVTIETSDFWYDLTDGGYMDPDVLLDAADAQKVKDAVTTLRQFKHEAESAGVLEEI